MITTYPHRPVSRSAPVRRRPVSRRAVREGQGLSRPLPLLAGVGAALLLICAAWMGWQVQHHSMLLSSEILAQDGLTRNNQALVAQRDRLLARENIVRRASALGLYPATPDQVRKIGRGSTLG